MEQVKLKKIGPWTLRLASRMQKNEKKVMVYGYVKAKYWACAKKEIDELIKKYR